jgi:hypothetical protein
MFVITSVLNIGSVVGQFVLKTMGFAVSDIAGDGLSELDNALGQFPSVVMQKLNQTNQQSIADMQKDLMTYPPANRSSTYVRSYTLMHGWENPIISTQSDTSYVTSIVNTVPYTPYVQVQATQALRNRKRWRTVEDVLASRTPSLLNMVNTVIDYLCRTF